MLTALALLALVPTRYTLLDEVRAALIKDELPKGQVVRLTGTCHYLGGDGPYSLTFDSHGRFVQDMKGPVSEVYGSDGDSAWKQDVTGAPVTVSFETKAEARALAMLLTDSWLDPSPDVTVTGTDTNLKIHIGPEGFTVNVSIDRKTSLPDSAIISSPEGTITVTMSDWKAIWGRMLPCHAELNHISLVDTFTVKESELVSEKPNQFSIPRWTASDTTFDPTASPVLEAKRALSGHIMIHPLINGQDVGWFILDSGAETMAMDPDIAKKLRLPKVGDAPETGVGGSLTAPIWSSDTVTVGPITMKHPDFIGIDLKPIAPFFGVPLAGIVGYNVFRRAVVEVSLKPLRIAIYDPAKYTAKDPRWEPVLFDGGNSAVRATAEGKAGWYRVDTGDSGTITFQYPYVVKEKLIEKYASGDGMVAGAGGTIAVKTGNIGSLELGGHTFSDLPALFASVDKGGFSDIFIAGNLGQKLMEPFTLIFDYQHYRLGFDEHRK